MWSSLVSIWACMHIHLISFNFNEFHIIYTCAFQRLHFSVFSRNTVLSSQVHLLLLRAFFQQLHVGKKFLFLKRRFFPDHNSLTNVQAGQTTFFCKTSFLGGATKILVVSNNGRNFAPREVPGIRYKYIWDTVKISVDYFSKGGSSCVQKVHQTM